MGPQKPPHPTREHEAAQGLEFWGLAAICRRMGWKHRSTPIRQFMQAGFPIFTRHRKGSFRPIWWTCEALIQQWFWTTIKLKRERLLKRKSGASKDQR